MYEFGQAYANAYQNTYNRYRYSSIAEREMQAQKLRDGKQAEPVGTPHWHELVGALTALGVLSGEDN